MADDYTQYQPDDEQLDAEKLSLEATIPPSEVPGYRMERFLGAGAFGQVWVARDLNTGRQVAIKFYLHRGGINWALLNREVKNLVALSADRHIVQVLEVGWDGEPPYYVMEYLEHGSLEDLLQRRERIPVEKAVRMIRDVCLGMNNTHGKGILHCDLKPANVLLDEQQRPRLADFGQSRLSHEQSPALGTMFYMAPEQADLDSVPDVRWDVYGMGAILYRMLTGTAPHRDDKFLDKIDTADSLGQRLRKYREAIVAAGPPDGHVKIPGVDRRLAQIVERCLHPDPERRYANVQQVIEAIDERDTARSRRPLILLGIVGPLLLLFALGGFAIRSIRETGKQFTTAMREERSKTNLSAAGEKARALEIELRSYFDLVAREASRGPLESTFSLVLDDARITELRNRVATRDRAIQARDEMLDDGLTKPIDAYLASRLEHYNQLAHTHPGVPKLATMFVTDSQGTILGIAYSSPVPRASNSAGKNYAYRTYFTGKKNDLPRNTLAANVDSVIDRTHLSSAFQSTATGLWKVAVSAPIRLPDLEDGTSRDPSIDGVFVATTNFGDFEQFRIRHRADYDVISVLVDGREGPLRGTILQHPWMHQRQADQSRRAERYQVPDKVMDQLLAGGDFDYTDPIASAPGSEDFQGDWIAAVKPVHLPQADQVDAGQTDWVVLVQFRLSKAISRVNSLTNKLIAEGIFATLMILLVNAALWYFVRRAGQRSEIEEVPPQVPSIIASQETVSIPD